MVKKTQDKTAQSMDELKVAAKDLRKEIFDLSMSHAKGQLKATTSLRTKKDDLARILTQITMLQFAQKEDKKGDK